MDRIDLAFKNKAFVGFLTAGDGGIDYTVESALALVEGGISILELGMPFSDPVGDGPVIQASSQRALKEHTHFSDVMEIARRIRKKSDIAIILFTYYNPLLQQGEKAFSQMQQVGIDGVLVVDLPIEEAEEHALLLKKYQLGGVFLATPSTADDRLSMIEDLSTAFVYYICQKGTTGMRDAMPASFAEDISRIRSHIKKPLVVGFGIKDQSSASQALKYADGFVVGSYFVNLMANKIDPKELTLKTKQIDPR